MVKIGKALLVFANNLTSYLFQKPKVYFTTLLLSYFLLAVPLKLQPIANKLLGAPWTAFRRELLMLLSATYTGQVLNFTKHDPISEIV